jgi:PAS domain S-box-containing protein
MIIVARDGALVQRIIILLTDLNLTEIVAESHEELLQLLDTNSPSIALIDANLGTEEVLTICMSLEKQDADREIAILVLVESMNDVHLTELLACGADDVVGRRLKPLSFRARVKAHLSRIQTGRGYARRVRDSEVLIDVTSKLVSSSDILDNLFSVANLISSELDVDRCSVVLVRPERDFGLVVASSDNPEMRSFAINLEQYPEIAMAVDRGKPLIIGDVGNSKLLKDVLPGLKTAGISSIALFPIVRRQETVGVIFLRFKERRKQFQEREVVFCQTVANAASIALRNAEVLEMLKAKTREMEKVQTETQVELRNLKRFEDFFVGGLDGMIVIEHTGKIVFVNPRASTMLNHKQTAFEGQIFSSLLVEEDRDEFDKLLNEFVDGKAGRSVDFRIKNANETERTMAISAASLFGEEGLMSITMRDVTEERIMEHQLGEAQRRLVESEKRSAMTELAGAAAHELNQPLTSVMTSLAYLRRLLSDHEKEQRIISTMEQESDRMASIIKRLTQITKYTTKSYVGKAKIIDLEKACDDPEEEDDR